MNGRKSNEQYCGIVPPSKRKSQSLIGKVIVSLQRLLEAPVPIKTLILDYEDHITYELYFIYRYIYIYIYIHTKPLIL